MDAKDFYGIYRDLAEQLGVETTIRIYEHLHGLQITFPVKLYSKSYIEQQIKERYDGTNGKVLAKELGYTERYFKKILMSSNRSEDLMP
ncbi:Mor transcription activator family protein [Clostridium sp. WB02_MRS01]|uniref:Mor transcription activator family protein n=1 Tax=Clostridium sp. WB02_MRS01 TaxID=2605777 RepID=UPI0012B2B501|nr:Mor transcription activator family protein [Clostridium sp. WB02_MRS01]MSS11309.1 Mor transcription activator family protein [Clostridium sp. WB02_MRS01]